MGRPLFQPGDIFLVDSQKSGAKIVKFLQTAPTWFIHIWRKIIGTQEKVLFYHVGIFYDNFNIIEQQSKVIKRRNTRLLSTDNDLIVVRKIGLTKHEKEKLIQLAEEDLGRGYGIVNIFGRFFTWLTGIPLFAMFMRLPSQNICVTSVSYWYKKGINERFGALTYSWLTTHLLYKHILAHPEKFEIIYRGNPKEDKLI